MIKDIRHTGIVIDDLEASFYFYRELLGFQIVKQMEEVGDYTDNILSLRKVKVTMVKITCPSGQMIELLKYNSHPEKLGPWEICEIAISRIVFSVNGLDMKYKKLKDKEV